MCPNSGDNTSPCYTCLKNPGKHTLYTGIESNDFGWSSQCICVSKLGTKTGRAFSVISLSLEYLNMIQNKPVWF